MLVTADLFQDILLELGFESSEVLRKLFLAGYSTVC